MSNGDHGVIVNRIGHQSTNQIMSPSRLHQQQQYQIPSIIRAHRMGIAGNNNQQIPSTTASPSGPSTMAIRSGMGLTMSIPGQPPSTQQSPNNGINEQGGRIPIINRVGVNNVNKNNQLGQHRELTINRIGHQSITILPIWP